MPKTGVVGSTIKLGMNFRANKIPFDPIYVGPVLIYTSKVGGALLDTLVPAHDSVGHYQVFYAIPVDLASGTYYMEWTWQAEADLPQVIHRYPFIVNGPYSSRG